MSLLHHYDIIMFDWLIQWPWPAISRVAFATRKVPVIHFVHFDSFLIFCTGRRRWHWWLPVWIYPGEEGDPAGCADRLDVVLVQLDPLLCQPLQGRALDVGVVPGDVIPSWTFFTSKISQNNVGHALGDWLLVVRWYIRPNFLYKWWYQYTKLTKCWHNDHVYSCFRN